MTETAIPAPTILPRPRIHGVAYVFGGLAFIPLLGVLPGLIALIWGLVSGRKGAKIVALLGGAGIAFTLILYGSLFYFGFVQRGGVYDGLRAQLAESQLSQLVPYIELYRVQHGAYPETLEAVAETIPPNTPVMINDAAHVSTSSARTYHYERAGEDHYYLRALGPDGAAFTDDDIVPVLSDPDSAPGLLVERAAEPSDLALRPPAKAP